MKTLTDKEIYDIKVDFVKSIMPNRKTFKSSGELIERLKMYRDLYPIHNETERLLVQGMITSPTTIPKKLIEQKKEVIETYECPYFCPSCGERLQDQKTFRRSPYGKEIKVYERSRTREYIEYQSGHLTQPNEYQVMCRNPKCIRYGKLIDIQLLKNSMRDNGGKIQLNLSRDKDGKFKSNK